MNNEQKHVFKQAFESIYTMVKENNHPFKISEDDNKFEVIIENDDDPLNIMGDNALAVFSTYHQAVDYQKELAKDFFLGVFIKVLAENGFVYG